MTISQDQGQDPQPRKRLGPADRARDDARLEAGPGSGNMMKVFLKMHVAQCYSWASLVAFLH